MGLVIIFTLVTLLAVFATLRTLREKNFLAGGFALATVLVFGWFTIMTVLYNGYPPAAIHLHARLHQDFAQKRKGFSFLFSYSNLYHLRFVFVLLQAKLIR